MTTEQIFAKMKEYFAVTFKHTNYIIENNWSWFIYDGDKDKCIMNIVRECLGIVKFSQDLGIAFEDVATLYAEYREKFKELLDDKELLP